VTRNRRLRHWTGSVQLKKKKRWANQGSRGARSIRELTQGDGRLEKSGVHLNCDFKNGGCPNEMWREGEIQPYDIGSREEGKKESRP